MKAYSDLVVFWFNKNKDNWFNSSPENDIVISDKYKDLLIKELMVDNTDICSNKYSGNSDSYEEERKRITFNFKIIIAKIILCDQISRHVYRNQKDEIKKYDGIAFELVKNSNILDNMEMFIPEAQCFILMPYRHTFKEEYLNICISQVLSWKEVAQHPMYQRFYYATLKSIGRINTNKDLTYIPTNIYTDVEINSVLDKLSTIYDSSLLKTNITDNALYNIFLSNIPKDYVGRVTVSVSGGVDSMVCLYLLKKYALDHPNITPCAIAINYKNRLEQDIEIYIVSTICKILEIQFFVREITEINRTRDADRELYENITREYRFDSYSKIEGPIILGHNLDDSLENIFNNIKKKKNYNNLFGMLTVSTEKNVPIWRPLLTVSKKMIINFAVEHNIPFIYDSTPSWSERGRIRDILIPAINSFDKDILQGLVDMTNNFKEIYKIYEKTIPNIEYFDTYCTIDNSENVIFFDYWRRVLTIIAKKYGINYVKNKSINNMINSIKNNNNNKITVSKNISVQIRKFKLFFMIKKCTNT